MTSHRRQFLKTAAAGVGAAATLGVPAVLRAQKTTKLRVAFMPFTIQQIWVDAMTEWGKQKGITIEITSGFRTVAQQHLLYRWDKTGRCGIPVAATPGRSDPIRARSPWARLSLSCCCSSSRPSRPRPGGWRPSHATPRSSRCARPSPAPTPSAP